MRAAQKGGRLAPAENLESAVLFMPEGAPLRPLNAQETSFAHPTALVDSHAEIGDGVLVGPYAIVGGQAAVGDGTQLGAHALVDGRTRIGRRCRVFPFAVLGTIPQDLKFDGCESYVEIGDDNIVREYVTVHRATTPGGTTRIGNGNLLMAYVHVAHDCVVGNGVILGNGVQLAGHVTLQDFASVGGLTPVHQFARVGSYAFVGGASRVAKDVPPYLRAAGNPLRVVGLNSIGLMRRGFPPETLLQLKRAYRLIYRSQLNVTQALERIAADLPDTAEIRLLTQFIRTSERGIEC